MAILFINIPSNINAHAPSDKISHLILFALLTYLWKIALNFKKIQSPLLKAFVISFFLAIISEVIQYFLPYRNGDFYDIIADSIGIILTLYLPVIK